jgi:hypothetical protein
MAVKIEVDPVPRFPAHTATENIPVERPRRFQVGNRKSEMKGTQFLVHAVSSRA